MHARMLTLALGTLVLLGLAVGLWGTYRLGGPRYLAHRLFTLEPWPTYTQRLSQLDLLPVDSLDVVLLGDSHVAYGLWQEWLPDVAVANRGISGDDLPGVRRRLGALGLSPRHAVVVQVGTNDLLFRGPDAVLADYDRLLDDLADLDVRAVAICTLPGVNNRVRATHLDADAVAAVNERLRVLAHERGVVLLDLAAALDSRDGVLAAELTDDGVHLRGEGYRRWARLLAAYLGEATASG